MAIEILLVPHHHFDPTWRRCFERDAVYNGVTVRSYAEVEAHCINRWLDLAGAGYPFSEGQAAVLRAYLRRHPAVVDTLRAHAREGRLDVVLAGETVSDTVLSTAEGLVRNFLVAMPFYRDLVGADHPGLKLGWLEDAFGNSPNYPQVLRGVGAEAACFTSYRPCPEPVWVGIDGTPILNFDSHPSGFAGGFAKHAPCPSCQGKGCAECSDTGMTFVDGFDLAGVEKGIESALERHADKGWVAIRLLTEEILPDRRVVEFVEAWNRRNEGRARIRFANWSEVFARNRAALEAAARERGPGPSADLNPAMPGCMVSRIRCKQRTRAIAYHLVAAEAGLANAAWKRGQPGLPPADLSEAWRQVAFNQFHDAITGTHIDSAHRELMDMLDAAGTVAAKYLKVRRRRPAAREFTPHPQVEGTQRIGQLDLRFDRAGILAVTRDGRDVFGTPDHPRHNNRRRLHRIAELVLEPDYGDAWGTRIPPTIGDDPRADFCLAFLGDFHTAVETAPDAVRWRGRYTGGDWKVRRLEWTVTAAASADGRRIDFTTDVNWDTGSRRLRVLVPVRSQAASAVYEVPFGFIERAYDPARLDYSLWNSNTLEYPTLHWVWRPCDERQGVALLNRGLPCNRWTPGRLDLSLVRSPEYPFCVVEPGSYEFWDTDGQRDAGRHRFEYSLFPYYDGMTAGELTRVGYAYNLPAPVEPPFRILGDVVVTAWKLAEDGDGWILRLQEGSGRGTRLLLDFGEETASRTVVRTNLLEQPAGEPVRGRFYDTVLHRHGILTLRIR